MVAEKGSTGMPASWNLATRLASLARRGLGPAAAMNVLARLRGSKLGLRTHLLIFGLAIVVPVLLYSAFLLHRYSQSERAAERAAGAADCPRAQRRHRPRDHGHHHHAGDACHLGRAGRQGLQELPSAGQGGAEVASVERARYRRQSPPTRQYAAALGRAAARQCSSGARFGARRAGDRASPMSPIFSWAPSPSAGSSPSASPCVRARTSSMRWSCRWSRSGWSRS